jgi:hypothetical protein
VIPPDRALDDYVIPCGNGFGLTLFKRPRPRESLPLPFAATVGPGCPSPTLRCRFNCAIISSRSRGGFRPPGCPAPALFKRWSIVPLPYRVKRPSPRGDQRLSRSRPAVDWEVAFVSLVSALIFCNV